MNHQTNRGTPCCNRIKFSHCRQPSKRETTSHLPPVDSEIRTIFATTISFPQSFISAPSSVGHLSSKHRESRHMGPRQISAHLIPRATGATTSRVGGSLPPPRYPPSLSVVLSLGFILRSYFASKTSSSTTVCIPFFVSNAEFVPRFPSSRLGAVPQRSIDLGSSPVGRGLRLRMGGGEVYATIPDSRPSSPADNDGHDLRRAHRTTAWQRRSAEVRAGAACSSYRHGGVCRSVTSDRSVEAIAIS